MPRISDERRAARRLQILDAAWTCFQGNGLHATSMDDIIRASDLSAGAVYSYFPSKEELIHDAVVTSLGGLRELVGPILVARPAPPPGELLRAITALVADFTGRETYDLRRVALLGWSEAQRSERLRDTMRGFYGAFRLGLVEVAESWRADGRLPDGAAPDAVAKLFLSAILGFVVQSALLGDVAPPDLGAGLRDLTRDAGAA